MRIGLDSALCPRYLRTFYPFIVRGLIGMFQVTATLFSPISAAAPNHSYRPKSIHRSILVQSVRGAARICQITLIHKPILSIERVSWPNTLMIPRSLTIFRKTDRKAMSERVINSCAKIGQNLSIWVQIGVSGCSRENWPIYSTLLLICKSTINFSICALQSLCGVIFDSTRKTVRVSFAD